MRLFKDKVLLISGGTGRFGNAVLNQMTFFEVAMEGYIDMNHELVQLSKAIYWAEVESAFSGYYCSDNGCLGVPIQTEPGRMKSLLPLREMAENLGLTSRSMMPKRGRKSYFTPEGKEALMFLMMK